MDPTTKVKVVSGTAEDREMHASCPDHFMSETD